MSTIQMEKPKFDWTHCMAYVANSDVGMRRSNNQDSFLVSLAPDMDEWLDRGHLFVVADGMGAHAAGELASKLAVENVAHIYRKHRDTSPPEALEKSIREANQEIHRRGEANLAYHNMGTTCSSLLLLPQGAVVGHVGDSRVYLCRANKLLQLTFDHSLVWEMQEAGQITDDENHAVPKNVITRSLGPQSAVKVDIEGPYPVQIGDTFLLCSDGLTGRVEDAEIATLLSALPPDRAAELLINLANLRGGPDNITVIVTQITANDIVSNARGVAPLEVGGSNEPKAPLNPLWWGGLGVCGLLAGALGVTHGLNYALVPLVMFVIVGLAIMLRKLDLGGNGAVRLGGNRRLGKGPHRTYVGRGLDEFVTNLSESLAAGRESAEARDWDCNWEEFAMHFESASAAQLDKNPSQSLLHLVDASHALVQIFKDNARAN